MGKSNSDDVDLHAPNLRSSVDKLDEGVNGRVAAILSRTRAYVRFKQGTRNDTRAQITYSQAARVLHIFLIIS